MTQTSSSYTKAEFMVWRLGQEVHDWDVIHIGAYTPLVLAASLLAKATHAPNARLFPISLSGVWSARTFPLSITMLEPLSMADGVTYRVTDLFDHVEGDEAFDFEPLSPAQIDMFGNLNNSAIGSYERPKVRLPGSAGLDNLLTCPRTKMLIYTTRHTKRVFVPKVDVISAPGYLDGPGARERAGIPGNGGPRIVISNLAVLDFDEATKRMRLQAVNPWTTVQEVQDNTSFELMIPRVVATTPEPTDREIEVLRHEVDPLGIRDLEFAPGPERRELFRRILDKEEEWLNSGRVRPPG